ncbi:hypothetical protein [Caballeronia sp. J97]|uniref:hypothetical protein n=1 Tax=Caballeronia sp. J97 TaxID=2805429 RepID=UPI002AAFCFBF|nr:hypothetical protein [Caballeronia sp. J97]
MSVRFSGASALGTLSAQRRRTSRRAQREVAAFATEFANERDSSAANWHDGTQFQFQLIQRSADSLAQTAQWRCDFIADAQDDAGEQIDIALKRALL